MRNQLLTGYLLHHKPYQENRALYYFFTPTHGLVHGVGKKGMPLFTHIQLFATGKRSLKSFSQANPIDTNAMLIGQNLYAGFYLNEILWKLLENEDPTPKLWQFYQYSLNSLREELSSEKLRLLLRYFERVLFNELGYGFNLLEDTQGQRIEVSSFYRFIAEEGFQKFDGTNSQEHNNDFLAVGIFHGTSLLTINEHLQSMVSIHDDNEQYYFKLGKKELQDWSRLYKQMIDYLLDYQPLKSRELWRQSQRYR